MATRNTLLALKLTVAAISFRHTSPGAARIVGGELGYVYSSTHRVDLVDGRLVHNDEMAHNAPRPDWKMSDEERRGFSEQVVN